MKVVFSSDFTGALSVKDTIDVFVFDSQIDSYIDTDIDVCIFDKSNINNLYKLKKVRNIVSCGMDFTDSVTFSSISEDSALVCIRRSIILNGYTVEPCEFKAPFDKDIGIYYNLVVAMIDYLIRLKGE